MTSFLGNKPLLGLLLAVGFSQLPAQSQTSTVPESDQIKANNLKHFIIENVYAEKIGAVAQNLSFLSFEIDVGNTTRNPHRLYSALVKLSKDTLDTLQVGVANYPDGNMTKLLADEKEFKACNWQGFDGNTPAPKGKANPDFNLYAYQVVDDIIAYKSAGLSDGSSLFNVLENEQQDRLIEMAQDSYVDAARPQPELVQAVRDQTKHNAVEYAQTLYRSWLAENEIIIHGLSHEPKAANGSPEMINAINSGKEYVSQLGVLGVKAAQRVALGIAHPPKAILENPTR